MKNLTLQNGMQIALTTFMVASLAFVAVGVRADEVDNVPARTVRYSDLNLNTQAGAAVLYKRIQNAATAVCGEVDSHRLSEAALVNACVQKAISASVSSVKSAKLTSEYKVHFGIAQNINVATR